MSLDTAAPPDQPVLQLLSEDGELTGPAPGLDDDGLVAMLDEMVRARVASERFFNLQRQGRAGTSAPIDGQEAAVVGAVAALDPATDWVVPQYREQVALGRYGPEVLRRYALYQRGHPAGGHIPAPVRVFPPQISLAAQIPHAVGLAWAMALRARGVGAQHQTDPRSTPTGASSTPDRPALNTSQTPAIPPGSGQVITRGDEDRPGVAAVFFGDGASSEGDFYEAANVAGVLGAPVILVCVNNGWAISTPTSAQTAAVSFAAKAAAFGIPGVRVDGNDALAMHAAMAQARARALGPIGAGPTLIEAVTWRMGPHTTADDPGRYRSGAEHEAWRARDPIVRLRTFLERRGLWSGARHEEAVRAAAAAVDEAWAAAEAATVRPEQCFDHVYAAPTPRMERQRAELQGRLAGRSETRP